MRKLIQAEVMQHSMILMQMGASVKTINSKLCYVTFMVGDMKVKYVYNINKDNRYFLERIKPYPLPLKELKSEMDVIELIKIDIEQFKQCSGSKKMNDFIHTSQDLLKTYQKFEDLFLYYNVDRESVKAITKKLNDLDEMIEYVKSYSDRVYHDKDPEHLK